MTARAEKLQRLNAVAVLKRDTESQALAAINGEIHELNLQVRRLRKILRLRSRDLELDPSRLSGADVSWVRRTEQQINALQRGIAAKMAEREARLDTARTAVGRAQAVQALVARELKPRRRWE